MTQNEYALCKESIAKSIQDKESAEAVQDLCIRLQSVASTLRSTLQESIAIFDEAEQIAKARLEDPITLELDFDVQEALDQIEELHGLLSSSLKEGERNLESSNVLWFAEEEPVEAIIDGKIIPCWHMHTDGETSIICLDYLGGPRMEVSLFSLRHRQEQS